MSHHKSSFKKIKNLIYHPKIKKHAILFHYSSREIQLNGISAEQQTRIFNGFEQAESSTTRRYGGTGLGLVISKRLVNLMGGELQLSSELGVGSRFWFDIELTIADSTPYAELTPEALADIRVLVVDDNPLVAEILQQTLSTLGFNTTLTNSGLAAIEAVKQAHAAGAPFDAVLMDWCMPDVDGLSAAQSISTDNDQGKPPIIVMVTAHEREVLASQGDSSPPYRELLTKPVTPHQMAKSIWQNVTGKALATATTDTSTTDATPLAGLRPSRPRCRLADGRCSCSPRPRGACRHRYRACRSCSG